jgi:hypothetical protein
VALVHGIRVHDPRHHPLVGVHVRGRHVGVGTQGLDDGRGIASGDPLQLAVGELEGITHDAALGTAERDVHHRALPSHPGGERRHLVQRHRHVEADPALRGTTRGVVQHAVAGVHVHLAVVAYHRHRHDDLLLGTAQHLVQAGIEAEPLGRVVETRHHGLERVLLGEERAVLVGTDDVLARA